MAATAESKLALPEISTDLHVPIPEIITLHDGTKIQRSSGSTLIHNNVVTHTTFSPLGSSEGPHMLIIPGLGGIEPTTMPLAAEFAKEGYSVTTLSPPRGNMQELLDIRSAKHTIHSLLHPDHLLSQAGYAVAKDIYSSYEIEQLHIIGHSMGGPAALKVAEVCAKKFPGLVTGVTLLASAGATGHDIVELAPKAADVIRKELRPNWDLLQSNLEIFTNEAELVMQSLKYFLHNPIRTIGETYMVTRADVRPGLQKLTKLGIETSGVFTCSDLFFNCEKAEETIGHIIDHFRVIDDPIAIGHLGPQLYPYQTAQGCITKRAESPHPLLRVA